jgi:general L-amino acid transport system substrate-binding protein
MKRFTLCLVIVMAVVLTSGLALAGTLADVKSKGTISVGVNEGLFGFSKPECGAVLT